MKTIIVTSVVCIVSIFVTLTLANAGCVGSSVQLHNPSHGYQFKTVTGIDDQYYDVKSHTCIENLSIDDIQVNWYLVNLKGWIPMKEDIFKDRTLPNKKYFPLESCLMYGNLGEWTEAEFFGSESDQKREEEENEAGCDAYKKEYIHKASFDEGELTNIGGIFYKFKNFFPSDPANQYKTMMKLTGDIYIKGETERSYTLFFSLDVEKYEGRAEGQLEELYARLSMDEDQEYIEEQVGILAEEGGLPLEKILNYSVPIKIEGDRMFLREAILDIRSIKGISVARLGIPIVVAE